MLADAANPFINLVGRPDGGTAQVARRWHSAVGAACVDCRSPQPDDAHYRGEPQEFVIVHSPILGQVRMNVADIRKERLLCPVDQAEANRLGGTLNRFSHSIVRKGRGLVEIRDFAVSFTFTDP